MPTDRLISFRRREDGAVAVVVSLLLTVLLGFVALGVDMAYLYRERAHLQSASDLTAVSAMAVPDDATPRATHVLSRNAVPSANLQTLQTGRYLRNPAIAASDRFTALPEGSVGVNAVRVVLTDEAPLHFAVVLSDKTHVTLNRTSLATRTGAASFSLGSHLAYLDGIDLNAVLAQRFGINATISIAGIEQMNETNVDLAQVLNALATATGGQSGNPADILDAQVTVADVVSALQSVLPPDVASDLDGLAGAGGSTMIAVDTIVGGIDADLGLTATEFLGGIELSALDIVRSLLVATTTGQSLALSTDVTVDGVLSATTTLVGGEPVARSGWVALGEKGVQLHRAAARLATDIDISPNLLGEVGVGVQLNGLSLPLHAEFAAATATLQDISCDRASGQTVAARFTTGHDALPFGDGTSLAALYLGSLPDLSGPVDPAELQFADLLDVTLTVELPLVPDLTIAGVTIQARSHTQVGTSQVQSIAFTHADVAAGNTVRTFGSGALLSSAVADLLSAENTEFRIKPEDQSVLSGLAGPLVSDLLAALPAQLAASLVQPVDQVLDDVLATAGLELGVGELTLTGHHCELIRLVR